MDNRQKEQILCPGPDGGLTLADSSACEPIVLTLPPNNTRGELWGYAPFIMGGMGVLLMIIGVFLYRRDCHEDRYRKK